MINALRHIIPERFPLRLWYHKTSAMLASTVYRFPGHHMSVIAVTGTSGKSTTIELLHYILSSAGFNVGSLSGIQFRIKDQVFPNHSLRTSLRPWDTQKWLQKMKKEGCEYALVEISSHAIDQNRHWGIGIDTGVITNIYDHEHLDYHKTFEAYKNTKLHLLESLNHEYRKPNVPKRAIINNDNPACTEARHIHCDDIWTYSFSTESDYHATNIELSQTDIQFDIRIPNHEAHIRVPLIGMHNAQNILCAITIASAHGVSLQHIQKCLESFPGVPARLEPIGDKTLGFSLLLDYTYKPSALQNVLKTLKNVTKKRLVVVWGGAGGRSEENWKESAKELKKYADEIVLTTDDPYEKDPRYISEVIKSVIERQEGDGFFDIPDRYEAIRYAILTAEKGDTVLIAGRGHESIQTIGKTKIQFEDKKVCEEILQHRTHYIK